MKNSNEQEGGSSFEQGGHGGHGPGHDGEHHWGHHHHHHGRGWFRRHFWKVPFVIAAIVAIKSALVLALWNHLIPELFHGPILTFPQAVGLTILAKLLVGFGGGPRHFGGPPWARKMKARWASLSPEERGKLRDAIRRRCGE